MQWIVIFTGSLTYKKVEKEKVKGLFMVESDLSLSS